MDTDLPLTEDTFSEAGGRKPSASSTPGLARLEEPVRLSESVLWERAKAHRAPPPSPSFVARAFVRAVRAFRRDMSRQRACDTIDVVDLNPGSGRFGFAFLHAWTEIDDAPALRYVFLGPAEDVELWQGHPQLADLAERGWLDFATWDAASDEPFPGGSPLVVIANDAFAAAPQDAFAILDDQLLECRLTLDAPAGTDTALDLGTLRCGHDYHRAEVPYYGDDALDGLLEEYRRELTSGHVLVPVGAFDLIRRLAEQAEGGLLVLNAGSGPVHLEELRDLPPPRPIRRGGSVSLPVNFHALGRQVDALGGQVFQPRTPPSDVAVSAYLLRVDGDAPSTREALADLVDGDGPDVTSALLRQLEDSLDEVGFDGVLAYLKRSGWDTLAARRALPRLQQLARAGLGPAARAALADATERTWNAHLHLGFAPWILREGRKPFDLAFELGAVLETAGLHRLAVERFASSLQRYGGHTATFFNLALCHLRLGEHDLAGRCIQRSLELDPDNAAARDLARQIEGSGEAGDAEPAVKDAAPSAVPYASNLEHLRGELQLLNLRLRSEVERWRSAHPPEAGLEELRGERLSDLGADIALDSLTLDGIGRLLNADGRDPLASLAPRTTLHRQRERDALDAGVALRLPELAHRLKLDGFERAVLLLALAPELDERYGRLFGYLNDNMQHRWPTVRLALRLFAASAEERNAEAWKLDAQGTLHDRRLLRFVDDGAIVDRSRGLRLEARTLAFLLDRPPGDGADPVLAPYLDTGDDGPTFENADFAELRDFLATGPEPAPILALDGPDALLLRRTATALAGALLVLRGDAVAAAPDPSDLVARALREVELTGRALLVEDAAVLRGEGQALHRLLTAPCSYPRLLASADPWLLPEACRTAPLLTLHVPAPDQTSRVELWRQALGELADGLELGELAGRFRLRSAQIDAAAHRLRAHLRSRPEDANSVAPALYAACRQQCFVSLDGLAQRIESVHDWDDLVVPRSVSAKLRGIENWLRYRHVVHHDWGFAERLNAGRGMAAMFCGSSGTGKTMAAGILGRRLDLDLYRIDLSSVVSKYIGETEKNLAKIFEAAEAANAILFFDEADALFGKRSEVKDAHDRYANIEVSYLLQRMESYDGIAILASNMKDNLDAAFARRLQVIVEFPFPTPADRERIWRGLFPEEVPQAQDVDMSFLGKQFGLSGGSIKNCALAAALSAAAEKKPVEMRHLIIAVARELEKLGKPLTPSALGEWGHLLGR